jgi:SH3 domain protein
MKSSDFPGTRKWFSFVLPLIAGALLLSQAGLASAKTQYVSDELVITFREGMGTRYRVIQTLKTGTPIEILEEDKDYYKARLKTGEVGYVLKQYLTDGPPKYQVIAAMKKEIEQLKVQLGSADSGRSEIRAQLAESQEKQQQIHSQFEETSQAFQQVQERYDDLSQKSENVVALGDERDRLSSENSKLTVELTGLRIENRTLLRTAMIQWFLAGGGVFFIGWISGKFSRKKRHHGFS